MIEATVIAGETGADFHFDNTLDDELHMFLQICFDNGYSVLLTEKKDTEENP